MQPYPEIPKRHDDQDAIEDLDQDDGLFLDTKSSEQKKAAEDEFKRKLQEISKRNEDEAKVDPLELILQKPVILGDEKVGHHEELKQEAEENDFKFELVNGSPEESKKDEKPFWDDDLVDLGKDSFYTQHTQDVSGSSSQMGSESSFPIPFRDPMASCVVLPNDQIDLSAQLLSV